MARDKTPTWLALLVFASCATTAFSIALLSMTFATGELPFGIIPLVDQEDPAKPAQVEDIAVLSVSEVETVKKALELEEYFETLYSALDREKARIAAEKAKVSEGEKIVGELKKNSEKLQNEVIRLEERIKGMLTVIDATELKNTRQLANLVSTMEPAAASKMLMEIDENMASRLIYYTMETQEKKAAAMMGALFSGGPEEAERAAKITANVHKLTTRLEP